MTYTIFFTVLFTVIFLIGCVVFWIGLIKDTKREIMLEKTKEVSIIDFMTFTKIFKSIDTELKVSEYYNIDSIRGDNIEIGYDLIKVNGKFYIPVTPIQYGIIRLYCKRKARRIYKKLYKKNKENKVNINWFKI